VSDPDANDKHFSARQVQEAAGLSYRQLNDWDERGAVPGQRPVQGWRRFTPREVFVLMVCAEIRKKLGVPVARLRDVQKFMLQRNADHLRAAVELMGTLGVEVWLVTDLEETFIMGSELEFRDLVEHGFLSGDRERMLIWLHVNPLVNRLLSCLKEPVELPSRGRGYEILRQLREHFGVQSREEFEVLQLIRSGDFEKIEVVLKNGKIRTLNTSRSFAEPEKEDLTALLRDHDFQTITLTKRDGEVVALRQSVPHKPGG
jgi:DNA-binding transcriptional MerR regulator